MILDASISKLMPMYEVSLREAIDNNCCEEPKLIEHYLNIRPSLLNHMVTVYRAYLRESSSMHDIVVPDCSGVVIEVRQRHIDVWIGTVDNETRVRINTPVYMVRGIGEHKSSFVGIDCVRRRSYARVIALIPITVQSNIVFVESVKCQGGRRNDVYVVARGIMPNSWQSYSEPFRDITEELFVKYSLFLCVNRGSGLIPMYVIPISVNQIQSLEEGLTRNNREVVLM